MSPPAAAAVGHFRLVFLPCDLDLKSPLYFALFFAAADQSRLMQEQMTGAAMAMPPDPNKAFKVRRRSARACFTCRRFLFSSPFVCARASGRRWRSWNTSGRWRTWRRSSCPEISTLEASSARTPSPVCSSRVREHLGTFLKRRTLILFNISLVWTRDRTSPDAAGGRG